MALVSFPLSDEDAAILKRAKAAGVSLSEVVDCFAKYGTAAFQMLDELLTVWGFPPAPPAPEPPAPEPPAPAAKPPAKKA
jgi:hypothetical protein